MTPLEIGGAHLRTRQQLGAAALHRDRAIDHHVAAMGELERMKGVLLDQKNGQALALVQFGDNLENLLDDKRRKSKRRLIQKQQSRSAHPRARWPASAARRPTAFPRAAARAL